MQTKCIFGIFGTCNTFHQPPISQKNPFPKLQNLGVTSVISPIICIIVKTMYSKPRWLMRLEYVPTCIINPTFS